MTILGIGLDATDIPRVEKAIARYGDRFVHRIFTETEIAYCSSKYRPAPHYAGRFAAKEAFIKSVGGLRGLTMRDIEILNDNEGKPAFRLNTAVDRMLKERGIRHITLSVTHTNQYASALVIMEA